jgi:hypothetical protein
MPIELPYAFNPSPNSDTMKFSCLLSRHSVAENGFNLYSRLPGIGSYGLLLANAPFVFAGSVTMTNHLDIDDVGLVVDLLEGQGDWNEFVNSFVAQNRNTYLNGPTSLAILVPSMLSPNIHEIIAFQTIAVETGGAVNPSVRLNGVIRRMFDTSRVSGTVAVFILPLGAVPFSVLEQVGWANGTEISFKAQPVSGSLVADMNSMDSNILTLKERALRPYAVENLLVGAQSDTHLGSATPKLGSGAQSYRLSWTARNRPDGCGVDDSFNNNTTVEPNLYFTVGMNFDSGQSAMASTTVLATATFVDDFGVTRYFLDVTNQNLTGVWGTANYIIAYVTAAFSSERVSDSLLDAPSIITRRET